MISRLSVLALIEDRIWALVYKSNMIKLSCYIPNAKHWMSILSRNR